MTKRGLRYVALPIGPGSIDREHVARFGFEVAAGEARPLYFFDSDGTRSGALWYIRRIATDRVDQQVARREAEELGLSDQTYWSAVTKYVSTAGTTTRSDDAPSRSPVTPLATSDSTNRPRRSSRVDLRRPTARGRLSTSPRNGQRRSRRPSMRPCRATHSPGVRSPR